MTIQKAKENGYTHIGTQFGIIPVYIQDDGECLTTQGINAFWDFILNLCVNIDLFLGTNYTFQAWQEKEI